MNKKNDFICPDCGKKIDKPLMLITSKQVHMSQMRDKVPVDEILKSHLESYGGVFDSLEDFKQIAYEKGNEPDYAKEYIEGDRMITQLGYDLIDQRACPACRSNITPTTIKGVKEVINVLFIGGPGSSKSSLLSAIYKVPIERPLDGKKEKIRNVMSPKSFEHNFYAKKTAAYPYVDPPTDHTDGQFNRQPLLYIKVGSKLLCFSDYPGEALKESGYSIPDNAVAVYLYDYNGEYDEQMTFFNSKAIELHSSGKMIRNEIIVLTKCDILNQDYVKAIMINPYEKTGFTSFGELLAARRKLFTDQKTGSTLKLYLQLKNYCNNIDVVCVAAYGCEAKPTDDGRYKLTGAWDPQYIYDLLLTIGGVDNA